jgi:hypothetical protein
MTRSVYLETTIIGYLAMRDSRDIRVASNQLITREWWSNFRHEFDIFVSQFVIDECNEGDPNAAIERRVFLNGLSVLDMNEQVELLAEKIAKSLQIPAKARIDAFHISIAAVHGIELLLTWNCRHIANPENRPKIEQICRATGCEPPVICTPYELLEAYDD